MDAADDDDEDNDVNDSDDDDEEEDGEEEDPPLIGMAFDDGSELASLCGWMDTDKTESRTASIKMIINSYKDHNIPFMPLQAKRASPLHSLSLCMIKCADLR